MARAFLQVNFNYKLKISLECIGFNLPNECACCKVTKYPAKSIIRQLQYVQPTLNQSNLLAHRILRSTSHGTTKSYPCLWERLLNATRRITISQGPLILRYQARMQGHMTEQWRASSHTPQVEQPQPLQSPSWEQQAQPPMIDIVDGLGGLRFEVLWCCFSGEVVCELDDGEDEEKKCWSGRLSQYIQHILLRLLDERSADVMATLNPAVERILSHCTCAVCEWCSIPERVRIQGLWVARLWTETLHQLGVAACRLNVRWGAWPRTTHRQYQVHHFPTPRGRCRHKESSTTNTASRNWPDMCAVILDSLMIHRDELMLTAFKISQAENSCQSRSYSQCDCDCLPCTESTAALSLSALW